MFLRLAFAAVVLGTSGATAATVSIADHQSFSLNQAAAARTAADAFVGGASLVREETFEGAAVNTATNQYVSPTVGTFAGLGGLGSGGSNVPLSDQIKVRSTATNIFGRQNLTIGGSDYLDSNDTLGFTWEVEAAALGLASFTNLAFFLMDAADQGGVFELSVDGTLVKSIAKRGNGKIDFIALAFSEAVTSATVRFSNSALLNDGFGVDQMRIYGTPGPAPVPVPPALVLLGSGLAVLGLFGRRRSAA